MTESSESSGEHSIDDLYRRHASRGAPRSNRTTRRGAAAGFQIVAAVVGPWSVGTFAGPVVIGVVFGDSALFCNPLLGGLSLLVIVLAAHALYNDSTSEAYLAGLLGLLMFPLYFIGTILSLVSLIVVWSTERRV